MTLTTELKDWLATNAGIDSCFSSTGINYTDPDGIARTGSTGDVLNAFVVAHMVGKNDVIIIANTNYTGLKSINNNQDMGIDDITWVYNNDGTGAESKYCVGVSPTPTPTPTPIPPTCYQTLGVTTDNGKSVSANINWGDGTHSVFIVPGAELSKIYEPDKEFTITVIANGYETATHTFIACTSPILIELITSVITPTPTPTPTPIPAEVAGVFEFVGPIVGEPTVILDLSELQMRQATDLHFEMNRIKITNTSSHPVYLAMRIQLFSGELVSCPSIGFVFDGVDKTDARNVRIKTLEVGETAIYNADFYQPATILGVHTICMLIHGAWSRPDLLDEIELVPG